VSSFLAEGNNTALTGLLLRYGSGAVMITRPEKKTERYANWWKMNKPDHSSYTPTDFLHWRTAKTLDITPKFQRRPVWGLQERSFLIDTLIREMPVPPIFLRNTYEGKIGLVRQVIDGQQRIRAVLDFVAGEYAISRKVKAEYGGKRFDSLSPQQQKTVRTYPFICISFDGINDQEILEIFRRLNTYAIQLSKQELRNGQFFGEFKQLSYQLAADHLEFWRAHEIFNERSISRMLEVQLTSELLIAQIAGMQDKKDSIDQFYRDFDDDFPKSDRHESNFRHVIDQISETFGNDLVNTLFRRPVFFYTLYCAIYHRIFGLPNASISTPKKKLSTADRDRLKDNVCRLSDIIEAARKAMKLARTATGGTTPAPYAKKYQRFIESCTSATDNFGPRTIRFETVYREALD
jgi:hypothetical protein